MRVLLNFCDFKIFCLSVGVTGGVRVKQTLSFVEDLLPCFEFHSPNLGPTIEIRTLSRQRLFGTSHSSSMSAVSALFLL